jgi:hypothetical protein
MTKRDPTHVELDHYRTSEDGTWHEWSCDTTGAIEKDTPSRLFLRLDDGSFLLEEDLTTSESKEARALETKSMRDLSLTLDQARWLAEVLPLAFAKLSERELVDTKAAIRERLREAVATSGKSFDQIEIEAGVPRGSVSVFVNDNGYPESRWLTKVADVVNFWGAKGSGKR